MRSAPRKNRERGFTLLEMLGVLVVLTIVLGAVFSYLVNLQKKYQSEESKIDITQQSREFMDQVVRDLHQAGYPSAALFDPSALAGVSPVTSSSRVAAGLVSFSPTDLWFEGDADGDGVVNVIRYTLFDNGEGNCPCTIKRSQTPKENGTVILSQTSTVYSSELQNVLNSTSTSPKSIAGTSTLTQSGAPVTVSNDTLYGSYKGKPVFAAFTSSGTPVGATSDPSVLSTIRTIAITINVLAPYQSLENGMRAAVSMNASARVGNN